MPPKARVKSRTRSASSSAKAKAKASGSASAGARAKTPSPKDLAAVRLQAAVRGYLARQRLPRLREQRRQHEAEMAAAVRETERLAIQVERRRHQQASEKAEAKRQLAKKLAEDTSSILEAAYEGDAASVRRFLDGGLAVDAHNRNGTTALSEAASGGSPDVVGLLLARKSNPNIQGEFKRTPLWRAAYAGHLELVGLLLESGGDPRLYDEQGCAPADVTHTDGVLERLRSWDTARTDDLTADFDSWAEDRRLEADFCQKQALRSVDAEFDAAKAAHELAQQALARAKAEFRNREKENGLALASGSHHAQQWCASAYAQVEKLEQEAIAAQVRFDTASLKRMEAMEATGTSSAMPGRQVFVMDLNNVLIKDLGNKIAHGKRWPLLIDPSDCAKKLVQYAGCALVNFWRHEELAPDRLRVALLSMIRAGGVLAVDLVDFAGGVDLALLADPFDQIRPGLFAELASRELLAEPQGRHRPRFLELARKEEKHMFSMEHFDEKHVSKFKFAVVTSAEHPHRELLESFDILRVTAGSN